MKPHVKHAALKRPDFGHYSRNEYAIIGTPCGAIKALAYKIIAHFSTKYKLAYLDADHGDEAGEASKDALDYGAHLSYTDKIQFHRIDGKAKLDNFRFRMELNEVDVAIINGNHFLGKKQIVFVDPKKEASLKKKLDRLTDVRFFILENGVDAVPEYLKEHIGSIDKIPVFKKDDLDGMFGILKKEFWAIRPPVNGLVLAGGKSVRMGKDKGLINYHGRPQREHVFNLLEELCSETFISCRPEQVVEIEGMPSLADTFMGLGPFGAMLSAFRKKPDEAWMVVACDLPFLNREAIWHLLENRNVSKYATAFYNPATEFPEPLITIWEPKAYPLLLQFLAQGYSCPRKVLINSDVELLEVPDLEVLRNVNEVGDYEEVMKKLKKL